MARETHQRLTAGKHTPDAVSSPPSVSCSIANRRSRSSSGSMCGSSDGTFPNSSGSYHATSQRA